MSALLELQRSFARHVLGRSRGTPATVAGGVLAPAERMSIYRNTARTTLTEALRLSFPAVDALVGGDFFDMAAARFIRGEPPRGGCLNDYGAAFPAFLAAMPETAALPYLGCVARFEWALAQAAVAADAPVLTADDLAGRDPDCCDGLCFLPHPSVRLLALRYAGDAIADAVLAHDDDALAALDVSARPCWLVVHRGPDGVMAERIDEAAYAVMQRLFAGEALDAIAADDAGLTGQVLAEQLAKGRFTAVRDDIGNDRSIQP